MTFSICINCGATKKQPINKCVRCGFKPNSDEEKAKSLMISTAYEINGVYKGKPMDELKAIATDLQAGRQYDFDVGEVNAVIAYAQQVMNIPARRLIFDGFKWIAPPVAILVLVYLLLFM